MKSQTYSQNIYKRAKGTPQIPGARLRSEGGIISPPRDCHPENDVPILPDIGMLASKDPVALDQACADLCCAATPLPNSRLTDNQSAPGFVSLGDPFRDTTPESAWESCLAHAEKIGLGSRTYELVKMK